MVHPLSAALSSGIAGGESRVCPAVERPAAGDLGTATVPGHCRLKTENTTNTKMRTLAKVRKTRARSRVLPPRLTKRGGARFSVRKQLRAEMPAPVIVLGAGAEETPERMTVRRDAEVIPEPERSPYDGNT